MVSLFGCQLGRQSSLSQAAKREFLGRRDLPCAPSLPTSWYERCLDTEPLPNSRSFLLILFWLLVEYDMNVPWEAFVRPLPSKLPELPLPGRKPPASTRVCRARWLALSGTCAHMCAGCFLLVLQAVLGGNAAPSAADVKKILSAGESRLLCGEAAARGTLYAALDLGNHGCLFARSAPVRNIRYLADFFLGLFPSLSQRCGTTRQSSPVSYRLPLLFLSMPCVLRR